MIITKAVESLVCIPCSGAGQAGILRSVAEEILKLKNYINIYNLIKIYKVASVVNKKKLF